MYGRSLFHYRFETSRGLARLGLSRANSRLSSWIVIHIFVVSRRGDNGFPGEEICINGEEKWFILADVRSCNVGRPRFELRRNVEFAVNMVLVVVPYHF